jgi:SAM-dependent methyltransferase
MLIANTHPRHEHDFYETPPEFVEMGLDLVTGVPDSVLDVGAGGGMWGFGARARWPDSYLCGCEIRPVSKSVVYDAWLTSDFLNDEISGGFDLVMSNPPFHSIEPIIRRSFTLLAPEGQLLILARLSFLEGKRRAVGLFREHPPKVVSVCASRPRFYDNRSGATAFAFYLWEKGWEGDTSLKWSLARNLQG